MHKKVIPAFQKAQISGWGKLAECGDKIKVISCNSCDTKHFAGHYRCRNRWCIPCNRVKALTWVAKLVPIFKDWINAGNHITMVNFTIKDQKKLSDGLQYLEEGWRHLNNSNKEFRKKFKERFVGGVRSLEVKLGENSKMWHPHFHCIVMQETYQKDFDWLKSAWEDSLSVVSGKSYKMGSVWLKEVTGDYILKSVIEVVKYIMKYDKDLDFFEDSERLRELYNCLKGKRQINVWGLLRGLKKEVELEIEVVGDEKKLEQFICSECGCTEGTLRTMLFDELNYVV